MRDGDPTLTLDERSYDFLLCEHLNATKLDLRRELAKELREQELLDLERAEHPLDAAKPTPKKRQRRHQYVDDGNIYLGGDGVRKSMAHGEADEVSRDGKEPLVSWQKYFLYVLMGGAILGFLSLFFGM